MHYYDENWELFFAFCKIIAELHYFVAVPGAWLEGKLPRGVHPRSWSKGLLPGQGHHEYEQGAWISSKSSKLPRIGELWLLQLYREVRSRVLESTEAYAVCHKVGSFFSLTHDIGLH
jgi:hypothetical protein